MRHQWVNKWINYYANNLIKFKLFPYLFYYLAAILNGHKKPSLPKWLYFTHSTHHVFQNEAVLDPQNRLELCVHWWPAVPRMLSSGKCWWKNLKSNISLTLTPTTILYKILTNIRLILIFIKIGVVITLISLTLISTTILHKTLEY